MILGLISDIHGNLAALKAVLADMETKGAEKVLCLGDVVGYGPFPGECLDLVQRCGAVLMGNHEEALLFGAENFNPRAKRAIDWTRDHLKADGDDETRRKRWQILQNLQLHAKDGKFLLAAVALMSGCFGGGDDDAPAPVPPPVTPPPVDPLAALPDSAKQSTDGLVAYLKTLAATTSDTRDPIDVTGVTLPQSDTADPTPL